MWAQAAAAALGIWLMASPAILAYGGAAATSAYVAGPIAAAIGFLAAWEILRGLRLANLAVGAWLVVSPWLLGDGAVALANSVAVGLALAGLALVRGELRRRYGGGWSSLVR